MKLSDLRRRIAAALAPEIVDHTTPAEPRRLGPLEEPSITSHPGDGRAQPLTPDQRANLEKLRDQLAPDRQRKPRDSA